MSGPLARMLRPVRLDAPVRTSLARGGVYSTIGLLAQGLLRFLTALLVGHITDSEAELGVVASAIATATILALLWPTTAGSAASKFLARARGGEDLDEARAIAAHLRGRVAGAVAVLGMASLPAWVLIDGGTWAGAASVGLLTVAYSGYAFTRGVQFGAGQVQRATLWDIASVVVGLGLLIWLLLAGVRGPALVLPLVVAYGLYTVAGWPYGRRGGQRLDRSHRREIDGFVLLGAVGTLASTGFLQFSQIAAKLAEGSAAAGVYAAALSLATPASMLAASLSLVLLPSMAEAWGRGDRAAFAAQTDQATRALAAVMVAIFGSIILASRLIVEVIWDEKLAGAKDLLPVLVLAVLATNLGVASVNALATRSQRGQRVTTAASVIGMVVGVIVWLVAAPRMGLAGVAVGYLCGTVVVAVIPVVVAWRKDNHRWGAVFGKVGVGVAVVSAAAIVQRAAALPSWLDPVFVLVFLAGWCALNWGTIAVLLKRR
ncbi:lipopolysaccharide biosynthesis protein [Actinokineospora sp. UTMC 2448]|uniref:lipopolysaccharide biosynthesis protein n=1 Tax=Actinokineospora sp. UTMC 2448 TaxID=2268449 RepID=UPI002164DEB3|nr:lipid II flippase MurJ [Actinokineospora sp. UTMC 2448]UVS82439.1 integral membrane protein MviN [Actinokineospora sp. UTMC 2448]